MPPKAKFTREEIIDKAFEIVRKDGFPMLTARRLGEALNSSARPIFTVFNGMEEVNAGVVCAAKSLYNAYVAKGLADKIPFKGVGTQYILFAINEPKLFQLLFMTGRKDADIHEILPIIDDNSANILTTVEKCYDLSHADAQRLYRHLWIYTHGIATLCATKTCKFTGEEISDNLTDVCMGLLKRIKDGKNDRN